jgi:GTP pyrophosphokinase
MDDIAEKGFAAHWKYKEGKIEEDNELEKWLKTIQEILSNPNPNAIDFLDTVKMNLFSSEIFVFTPKGEIKTLPQGSTALDFAYSIHTRIGDHCLGAKINHTLVPLSQKLSSGDQIEILTSQSVYPQPEWLNFVSTAKARTKIEASIRRQRRRIAEKGKNMLDELFDNEAIDNTTFNKILFVYNASNKEDLYFLIGNNDIILPQDKQVFIKVKNEPEKSENLFVRYMKQAMSAIKKPGTDHKSNKADKELAEVVENKENVKIDRKAIYKLAEQNFVKNFIVLSCCNPLPGDDVFGYITDNEEVEVHKRSCQNGLRIKSNHGDRIIDVAWGDYRQYSFLASIVFTGIDRVGILGSILAKLAEDVIVNIQSVKVSSNDGIFEGVFNVHVHSAEEVNQLCAKIAKVNGVSTVHRSNL